MSTPEQSDPPDTPGPVEAGAWPETLPACVASPSRPRHVHGYALLDDLGRHYDFGEVAFTLLAGTAPTADWGRAVNLAFAALAGTTIADAPVHAATLARRCTAPARTALAIGMLGLAEQADHELHQPPGDTDEDAAALWALLPDDLRPHLDGPPTSATGLAIRILRGAGLTSDTQLIAAISMARLPTLAAEVDAVQSGDVRGYPMRLPDFEYEPDDA